MSIIELGRLLKASLSSPLWYGTENNPLVAGIEGKELPRDDMGGSAMLVRSLVVEEANVGLVEIGVTLGFIGIPVPLSPCCEWEYLPWNGLGGGQPHGC